MDNNKIVPNHIQILIVDYLSGKIDKKNFVVLKNWLKKSSQNQQEFNEIKTAWLATESIRDNNPGLSEEKWLKFKSKLNNSDNKKKSFIAVFQQQLFPKLRYASIIVFFIALSIGATLYFSRLYFNPLLAGTEVTVPMGSKSMVKLPDGSTVWLNAGSKLKYSNDLNVKEKRIVELTGEGYFKVKANPDKPFIVKASNLDIIALGTSFNVKAYPQEKKVVATLVEGKVDIKGHDDKKFEISLKPNEKITYFKQNKEFELAKSEKEKSSDAETGTPLTKNIHNINAPILKDINVPTEIYTSWKDDQWIIKSEKLEDLVVMLERRYNVSIEIKSPELNKYLFSGTFENETLEQVFLIIRLTIPISYTIDKGVVYVELDKTLKERYESAY